MSNSIGLTNDIKKVSMSKNDIVSDSNCNVIIPYVPSGYEDYSNLGFVKGQYKIDNFLTYKRLYTGNDAFIITWKGSTHINKEIDYYKGITTTWQLGEYFLGYNEGYNSDVVIDNDASFSEYKKYGVNNTLIFRISPKYELNENYKYLFYKVPEISNEILYRVVSLETEYVGREKVCYVLTLQSLQQDLENTGRAKSQNVMNNAPGQGYIEPLIISKEEYEKDESFANDKMVQQIDKDRYLTYNKAKFRNRPCRYVVVKMFGLGILMNFTMVGRWVNESSEMSSYGIPKLVFPMNFKQATTPTLYRTQQPSNNYYFVWSLRPVITFKKEAFDFVKDLLDINKIWPHQGILEYDVEGGEPIFKKTNPITSGEYKYTLYGIVQTPTNLGGLTLYNPWAFSIGNNDLVFNNAGTFGSVLDYKIYGNETRNIHDYLWDSYWIQKKVRTIPLSKHNTLTFGNVLGSGVQGILTGEALGVIAGSALFSIGLLGTLLTKIQVPKTPGIMGIVPAELTDFMINEASGSIPNLIDGTNWFKLSYYLNNEENDFLTFFNTETINTSFEAELTSTFETKEFYGSRNTFSTEYIGQTHDSNGDPFLSNSGREPLLVRGGEKLKSESDLLNEGGYIIDSFNLQSMFKGDFSVEFLDKDREVIWSGVYQSEAKWTGSIREINTWRNTSIYGRENIFLEEPKPWPDKVPFPTQWGVANDITINMKSFNKYVFHNGVDKPESIVSLFSGKGWGWEDKDWNDTTYTGEKTDWVVNGGKIIPLFPKTYFDFRLERMKDIKLLDSNVLIEPKAFFEKYGEIWFNYKVNGKDAKIKMFDKNDTYNDEGTYIGARSVERIIEFEDDNWIESHTGYWYASFDGEWDGLSNASYYGGKKSIGSAPTSDFALAPTFFMKQKATIKFVFTIKFKKDGGIWLDIDIVNFKNEINGFTEKAKLNFEQSKDYCVPSEITLTHDVPRCGFPVLNKCDFKLNNIVFGTLPIKAIGIRKKGSSDYNKPPSWEKTKSIGYICGFQGVSIECKVLK